MGDDSHDEVRWEENPRTLGGRLRKERVIRGWSLDSLSIQAGIPRGTIYLIEVGRTRNPNDTTLYALARALGTTVEKLRSGLDPEEADNLPDPETYLRLIAPDADEEMQMHLGRQIRWLIELAKRRAEEKRRLVELEVAAAGDEDDGSVDRENVGNPGE